MQLLKVAPNIKNSAYFTISLFIIAQVVSRSGITLTDTDSEQLAGLLAAFIALLVAHTHDVITGQNIPPADKAPAAVVSDASNQNTPAK